MLKIGLTGGIGCGKSTVGNLFAELGIPVIDTDTIAHELVRPGQQALASIKATFGEDFIQPDGCLDRAKLRSHVFADAAARERLESILHPLIKQEMLERAEKAHDAPYCIFAIPLLYEQGWGRLVDRVLVIDCTPEQQITRTVARSGLSENEILAIMATQFDRARRISAADDIIENTGDPDELLTRVDALHRQYIELASNS